MAETEWSTITPEKGEPQEKIEFEIEGQEEEETPSVEASAEVEAPKKPEIEIEQEEEEPAVTAEASEEGDKEDIPEEKGIETSGAQKRIRQLVAQKKEREAEIEKLLESNKQMQLELQQQKQEYLDAVGTNLKSSETQVNEKLVIARDSYKRAIEGARLIRENIVIQDELASVISTKVLGNVDFEEVSWHLFHHSAFASEHWLMVSTAP